MVHAKHIAIALVIALGIIGAFIVRGKYDAAIADRMAKRDEQISANQIKTAQIQKDNKTDTNAITERDLQNARDIASLRAQASQPLTQAQIDAIIARLSGVVKGKDAQGNDTTTVGTGYLADVLNKFTLNQQICDKNLGTCEADKANLNQIIGRLTTQTETDKSTIGLQEKQITDLGKFQVPRWTLGVGVSKTPGVAFQSAGSYEPNVWVNYRAFNRAGFWGGVQNKSLTGGVSIAIGGVPK